MNFQIISLKLEYRSPQDDVVKEVFIPALKLAKSYKRAVGFFSSTSLAEITKGISSLVENGGTIQIVASPALSESDGQAIKLGYEKRKEVIEKKILGELDKVEDNYFRQERLNLLANLIANNILDLKIAFTDTGKEAGIYHEKLGIFEDFEGNKIAFDGSMNESVTAMRYNYESVNVYCSWKEEDIERTNSKIKAFDNIWNNTDSNLNIDIGERAGSGIPGVFSVWNKEFGMETEYSQKISPERTTTILRLTELVKTNNRPNDSINETLLGKLPSKLPSNLEVTFRAICEDSHASNQELAARTNQSERTIRNHTAKLKELNYIKRVGSDKTGYWEIVK